MKVARYVGDLSCTAWLIFHLSVNEVGWEGGYMLCCCPVLCTRWQAVRMLVLSGPVHQNYLGDVLNDGRALLSHDTHLCVYGQTIVKKKST